MPSPLGRQKKKKSGCHMAVLRKRSHLLLSPERYPRLMTCGDGDRLAGALTSSDYANSIIVKDRQAITRACWWCSFHVLVGIYKHQTNSQR
ncbi:hypothetical protein LZ32DRAFT_405761 [Colletotrichum eremochloae]|nr:hypothetical protein LZ32DRAFT_405761 [Colletotrichum eremochloae]